jgi:prepilin-type N-terminal cleavage/methylation domain-containing protein
VLINSKYKIQNTKYKSGFTLMEIVIVLGILGIIITGVMPLYMNVIVANKSAAYYSSAYKVADSMIEAYRGAAFDTIVDGETGIISELPGGEYTLDVTSELNGSPEADIKKVDLVISWDFKKERELRVVTYISRSGM